jgi:hypothetical protein
MCVARGGEVHVLARADAKERERGRRVSSSTLAKAMREKEWCMMRSTEETAAGDSVPSADCTNDCSSSIANWYAIVRGSSGIYIDLGLQ